MKTRIGIFIIFIYFYVLLSAVITRTDVLNTAAYYNNCIILQPLVDTLELRYDGDTVNSIWTSFYRTENTCRTLAYCFGGFDSPAEFGRKIITDSFPAGGYGTENIYLYSNYKYTEIRNHIAGIDCSGFIHRVWGFSTYDAWNDLLLLCTEIDTGEVLAGDWISKPRHQILFVGRNLDKIKSYESTTNADYANNPGVTYNDDRDYPDSSHAYSIFPQFSNFSPSPETIIIAKPKEKLIISCDIKAAKTLQNIEMFLDSELVEAEVNGDDSFKTVNYEAKGMLFGYHEVKVYAEHLANNLVFGDTTTWCFYYGDDTEHSRRITDEIQQYYIPYPGFVFYDMRFTIHMNEDSKMYLAGDRYGIEEHWVDDSIEIHVTDEYGNLQKWGYNYSRTGVTVPEKRLEISSIFSPGKNDVRVILMDDSIWGTYYGCSELWMVNVGYVSESIQFCNKSENNIAIQKHENNDFYTIRLLDKNNLIKNIEIYDITGRQVQRYKNLNNSKYSINLNKLVSSGVYFYRITTTNGTISGKLLKY